MHTGFWWGKLHERGHYRKQGRSLKDNIKMVLNEIQWEEVDWTHPDQD